MRPACMNSIATGYQLLCLDCYTALESDWDTNVCMNCVLECSIDESYA